MDTSQVWAFFSYAWTQTCADEDACRSFVRQTHIGMADLRVVERLLFKDICASFAVDSLWLLFPDWGYDAADLQQQISRWHARPYGWHLLNPLRLLGYPIALHLAWPYRAMLRRCVFAQTQN